LHVFTNTHIHILIGIFLRFGGGGEEIGEGGGGGFQDPVDGAVVCS